MRQAKIVIGVEQHQLLPQAVLPLAQRGDPTPDRGHMLADREVQAVTVDRRIAPPTAAPERRV